MQVTRDDRAASGRATRVGGAPKADLQQGSHRGGKLDTNFGRPAGRLRAAAARVSSRDTQLIFHDSNCCGRFSRSRFLRPARPMACRLSSGPRRARARRQIPVVIWEAPARMQIRTARQWRSRGPRINKSTTRPRSLAVYCAIMLCSREVILFGASRIGNAAPAARGF